MDVEKFWRATLAQDAEAMRAFFHPDAEVRWHCTNERFSVEGFIRANCEYPGSWRGEIERAERMGDRIVSALRVWPEGGGASFHVASFFQLEDGKIRRLDEYWADDGEAPEWRRALKLSAPIRAASGAEI